MSYFLGLGVFQIMNCQFCNSPRLRYTRFRAKDALHALLLRLPVRCRNCQSRSYVWIGHALEIWRATKLPQEPNRGRRNS
jgi:hypothetical protein